MSLLSLEFHSIRSNRNFFSFSFFFEIRNSDFAFLFISLTLITIMTEKKFGIVYFQLFNGCWLAEIVSKSRKKLQQQDIFPPFFIWRPKTHKKPVMSVWELRAPMTVWIVRKRQTQVLNENNARVDFLAYGYNEKVWCLQQWF